MQFTADKWRLGVALLDVLDEETAPPLLDHHLEGEPDEEGEEQRAHAGHSNQPRLE